MLARRLAVITVTLASVVLLAGCVPTGDATPTPTATPSESASATPQPTTEPSAEPTASSENEPVTIACADLVSLDEMYAFDPNYSLLTSFTPAPGSAAAEAVANRGIACRWVQNSSGVTIDFAVAHLNEPALIAKKSEAQTTSDSVSSYGADGFFSVTGSTGTAQIFSDPFWLTAASENFVEPEDAAQLVQDATTSLN